jgi:hypothetical protein
LNAWSAVALVVLAAAVSGIAWLGGAHRVTTATESAAPVAVATTSVTRKDMSVTASLSGTLGYGSPRAIRAGLTGMITWLPAAGSTITRGLTVYRVDNRPVPLLYGSIPLYRTLDARNTVGRDVRMLADNLRALGYPVGVQPRPGAVITTTVTATPTGTPVTTTPVTTTPTGTSATTTRTRVRRGEGVLTASLIAAVKRWQGDLGLPADGHLPVGSVVVLPQAVRVGALAAQVGDAASGDLMSVTSTGVVITVQADQGLAVSISPGDRATVILPDSRTTSATVTAVGTAVQADQSNPAAGSTLNVTLVLGDPSVLHGVDSAAVQVGFISEAHRQVLTVPVGALLALSGGGYALQPPDGALIAVRTGIFASGFVEVSGSGVAEGMKVVTTS